MFLRKIHHLSETINTIVPSTDVYSLLLKDNLT